MSRHTDLLIGEDDFSLAVGYARAQAVQSVYTRPIMEILDDHYCSDDGQCSRYWYTEEDPDMTADLRKPACWKCDVRRATTDIGLCSLCLKHLRTA